MKKLIVIATLLLAFSLIKAQIFVKPNGNGDGSSWNNAISDLNAALSLANYGDEIWVAAGTYVPSLNGNRNKSFLIPDGVKVYGGFNGHESDLYERNITDNPTILSGEINSHVKEDNSYTVVLFEQVSSATVLDGFTIENGHANGQEEKGNPRRCGGAIFNDGSFGQSNPTITNCVFRGNVARDGAAIYNFGYKGEASPQIKNCSFLFNKANFDGGAINNNGNHGICNAVIKDCTFYSNEASYGAGISNQCLNGNAQPLIAECNFSSNTSYIEGSSIYNASSGANNCAPVIRSCGFKNNTQSIGPDVAGDNDFIKNQEAKKPATKSNLRFGRADGK